VRVEPACRNGRQNKHQASGSVFGRIEPAPEKLDVGQLTGAGGGPIKTESLGRGNAQILQVMMELCERVRSIGVPQSRTEAPPT
jgi:hypothetical protein